MLATLVSLNTPVDYRHIIGIVNKYADCYYTGLCSVPTAICTSTEYSPFPNQTSIKGAPVSRGDCACLHVFADCPEVTSDGLRHLGCLSQLGVLRLGDLPANCLTDAVLESLEGYSGLELLGWGWETLTARQRRHPSSDDDGLGLQGASATMTILRQLQIIGMQSIIFTRDPRERNALSV